MISFSLEIAENKKPNPHLASSSHLVAMLSAHCTFHMCHINDLGTHVVLVVKV